MCTKIKRCICIVKKENYVKNYNSNTFCGITFYVAEKNNKDGDLYKILNEK